MIRQKIINELKIRLFKKIVRAKMDEIIAEERLNRCKNFYEMIDNLYSNDVQPNKIRAKFKWLRYLLKIDADPPPITFDGTMMSLIDKAKELIEEDKNE